MDKHLHKLNLLFILMTLTLACSKGNHSSPTALDDVLINEPVIAAEELTEIVSNSDILVVSTTVNNFPMPISECLKDNILRLRANTTYTLLVGEKCDDTDVDIDGTWDINVVDGHVQIRMNQNSEEDLFQVLSYSSSFMTVITNKDFDGTIYSVKIEFSIQETQIE